MPTHTVAVVQAGTSLFDTPATLERMRAHCETVKATGADLVVFPEAYVGGYPKGLDFGARLGSRTPQGRDDFLRYFRSAIDVPGSETAAMGEFAASMNSHMVVGVIERGGSTLYCTALFFGPDGAFLAKHRKLLPTAMERIVWGRGDGSTMPVLDTAVGKIGAAICWENYMPAYRQTLYAKGIELYCAPTVDDREVWQSTMRHIATEGRSFVLCACQYLTRADAPADYACVEGDDPATVLIRGGSVIVGPLGDVLAGPVYGREAVLSAQVDLEDLVRARYDFDPSGHYARPDVFKLTVDESVRAATFHAGSQPPSPFGCDPDD
ncbi:carbon-nitrogen hydrolase family protein [soil metagenome]